MGGRAPPYRTSGGIWIGVRGVGTPLGVWWTPDTDTALNDVPLYQTNLYAAIAVQLQQQPQQCHSGVIWISISYFYYITQLMVMMHIRTPRCLLLTHILMLYIHPALESTGL